MPSLWRLPRQALGLALATVFAGCASTLPAGPAALTAPEAFREGAPPGPPTAAAPADGWWRLFDDPALDALVQRAQRDNPGLQQALARTARAQAALQAAGASAWPVLQANAGVARRTGALVNAAGDRGNLYTAELTLQHDLDPWRRIGRAEQAARHDVVAQQALARDAALALQAGVAQAWLQWRAAQAAAPVLSALVDTERALVAQLEHRVQSGLASASDLVPAREQLRDDEAEQVHLSRRQAQALHALAALVGDPLLRPDAPAGATLPPLPAVGVGVPAALLQRRSDIAAADAALQAARLRLGLARDAWFPQITLTASAGLASADLGQWLRAAARSTGLGLLLALPMFDGGSADAVRAAHEAELQHAAAEHRQRVLQALREVDDQLAALRALAAESALRESARAEAERDAARARSRRVQGLAAESEALRAEAGRWRQQHALLQVQLAQRVATIALVQALGGGWGAPTATAASL